MRSEDALDASGLPMATAITDEFLLHGEAKGTESASQKLESGRVPA
jgi:hypothetical protein